MSFLLCSFVPSVSAYYTGMPASVVIGQDNFTTDTGGTTAYKFNTGSVIRGLFVDSKNRLIVSDTANNRVLIWHHVPTENGTAADIVLGQPDFISSTPNNGGRSAQSLFSPRSVYSDGEKLYVLDGSNGRVLIWDTFPTSNFQPATTVVGQVDMSSASSTCDDIHISTSGNSDGLWVHEGRIFAADNAHRRVLVWNSESVSTGHPADIVLGQTDMNTCNVPVTSASSLNSPRGIMIDPVGRLFVVDGTSANRVLIWNTIPSSSNAPADLVLGQQNFTSSSANNTEWGMDIPIGVFSTGQRIFVAGNNHNRVMIWNSIPTENGATPDVVLGQPNLNTYTPNTNGISASSFEFVHVPFVWNNKLLVSDGGNARVLIFDNSLPSLSLSKTITGQPDGKLRFNGTAQTNITNQTIKQIEYSVNGSSWTGGFATDGKFDSAQEDYYFDFDPSSNTMADNQGFTVKIRATHNNDKDTGASSLYFEPFQSTAPSDNTFSLHRLPTFTFTIQKVRFNDLKENLDRFRITISTDGVNWQPYIENIPVDYNEVRLNTENLQPNKISTMSGIYEDTFKTIKYEQENSVLSVTPKGVDWEGKDSDKFVEHGGKLLGNNTYYWRVEALDNAGQIQYTEPKILRIGSRQVVHSKSWFPLALQIIGGKGTKERVNLSTAFYSSNEHQYTVNTSWPWFSGIASAGSTVSLKLRKSECKKDIYSSYYKEPVLDSKDYCSRLYQAQVQANSTFNIVVPWELVPDSYEAHFSVKDSGDNYNELPPFVLTIQDQ